MTDGQAQSQVSSGIGEIPTLWIHIRFATVSCPSFASKQATPGSRVGGSVILGGIPGGPESAQLPCMTSDHFRLLVIAPPGNFCWFCKRIRASWVDRFRSRLRSMHPCVDPRRPKTCMGQACRVLALTKLDFKSNC
jgi:hypothetical protein